MPKIRSKNKGSTSALVDAETTGNCTLDQMRTSFEALRTVAKKHLKGIDVLTKKKFKHIIQQLIRFQIENKFYNVKCNNLIKQLFQSVEIISKDQISTKCGQSAVAATSNDIILTSTVTQTEGVRQWSPSVFNSYDHKTSTVIQTEEVRQCSPSVFNSYDHRTLMAYNSHEIRITNSQNLRKTVVLSQSACSSPKKLLTESIDVFDPPATVAISPKYTSTSTQCSQHVLEVVNQEKNTSQSLFSHDQVTTTNVDTELMVNSNSPMMLLSPNDLEQLAEKLNVDISEIYYAIQDLRQDNEIQAATAAVEDIIDVDQNMDDDYDDIDNNNNYDDFEQFFLENLNGTEIINENSSDDNSVIGPTPP